MVEETTCLLIEFTEKDRVSWMAAVNARAGIIERRFFIVVDANFLFYFAVLMKLLMRGWKRFKRTKNLKYDKMRSQLGYENGIVSLERPFLADKWPIPSAQIDNPYLIIIE